MKILEMASFSAGICGVWNRVREESVRLAEKGHEVRVFSSDFVKGSNDRAKLDDSIGRVKIQRFKAKKLGGESYMIWDESALRNAILEFKPNVILAHGYRHTHTVIASRIAKEIGAKVFLVTHAPFGDDNRSFIAKGYIRLINDPFVGKPALKRFDKIIAITKWEMPYLRRLGVSEEKIVYIPNGIPEKFFSQKKSREMDKILFLGRVSPIKNIETLISAMSLIKDKNIILEIVGPAEEEYLKKLNTLVEELNLGKKIVFSGPIYKLEEKIKKIDSGKIFVLPSKREAMPQALIEAMARGKIAISSNNAGSGEIIQDGKNGYLFEIGDEKELANKINLAIKIRGKNIQKEAISSVKQFSWDIILSKIEALINENSNN